MSNSDNELSSLINQLSRGSSANLSLSKFIQPLTASTPTGSTSSSSLNAAASGVKSLSVGSSEKLQSIQFGKPSNNSTSTASSGSNVLENLLSQAASGGLSSALSSGLSSIAGLGGLISSITNLFGGSSKAAPPPLVLFSLPDSIQQTAYVSSSGTTAYGGDSVEQSSKLGSGSAIYTTSGVVKNASQSAAPASTDSTSIAQAVKNALLTSNTLGDVIAEI